MGIIVNLYKLHFLSFHFSFQPNKRVFHPPTFPSLQPNTHEGKLNIFYFPTFSSSHLFSIIPLFNSSNQTGLRTLDKENILLYPSRLSQFPSQQPSPSGEKKICYCYTTFSVLLTIREGK